MNLKINISEDQELRNYIKELIKWQVISIVRDDIKSTIKEELKRISEKDMNIYLRSCLQTIMPTFLRDNFKIDRRNDAFIAPYINEHLNIILSSMNNDIKWIIAKIMKEKLSKIIEWLDFNN